ncbi:MAG: peptide-methionine (S)-S-oxide reductase MsrA [Candidatus Latescibacterota bacterium]|nr:peptide-methionine (S)-S-oxide reductase MsrA [Candidatus Latescibacterota bacterium]
MTLEKATLGGGCFWCLEAAYEQVNGVQSVTSGYAGGQVESPTYEAVCSGTTGHAEVVQLVLDTQVISFEEILEIFFGIHDPTTVDRQGNDVGPHYRSAIFPEDDMQLATSQQMVERLTKEAIYPDPIVTQIEPLARFWPAEAYHHSYFQKNPGQPYCMMVVGPKVAKFRQQFAHHLQLAE